MPPAAKAAAAAVHVALLRAINVGGTGKLAMADLRALCEGCGFTDVATYIQSGNVVLRSKLGEAGVKKALEAALAKKMGKPFGALVRSAAEMQRLAADPPFAEAPPNFVYAHFFDEPLAKGVLDGVVAPGGGSCAAASCSSTTPTAAGRASSSCRCPRRGRRATSTRCASSPRWRRR